MYLGRHWGLPKIIMQQYLLSHQATRKIVAVLRVYGVSTMMASGRGALLSVFCLALPAMTSSGRVLVTSYGGSGEDHIMRNLQAVGYETNSPTNEDLLKHSTASATMRNLHIKDGKACAKYGKGEKPCYDRIIVVEHADPAKAIATTVGKYGLEHYRLLSRGCKKCRVTFKGQATNMEAQLESIYSSSGAAGVDVYGVGSHLGSWAKVAESHRLSSVTTKWPPLLFVDAKTLGSDDFQCALYAFLGLDDDDRRRALSASLTEDRKDRGVQRRLDPETLMDDAAKAVYTKLRDRLARQLKISKVAALNAFWNATKACRVAKNPNAEDERPPKLDLDLTNVQKKFAWDRKDGLASTFTIGGQPQLRERDAAKKNAKPKKRKDDKWQPPEDPVEAMSYHDWDTMLFNILKGKAR